MRTIGLHRKHSTSAEPSSVKACMQVKIEKPIMRVPMLAIHLNRTINSDGFHPNKQTELVPILATAARAQLNSPASGSSAPGGAKDPAKADAEDTVGKAAKGEGPSHHLAVLQVLAETAGCKAEDIVDMELNCCDTQPGQLGGLHEEFAFVGRLDNLAMCWCSMQACPLCWLHCNAHYWCTNADSCQHAACSMLWTGRVLTHSLRFAVNQACRMQALIDTSDTLDSEAGVRAVACFDHEEVGSSSAVGAGGPLMRDTITRVSRALAQGTADATERCLQRSFLVSADMAHGLHPNYADKHEPDHKPEFHKCVAATPLSHTLCWHDSLVTVACTAFAMAPSAAQCSLDSFTAAMHVR